MNININYRSVDHTEVISINYDFFFFICMLFNNKKLKINEKLTEKKNTILNTNKHGNYNSFLTVCKDDTGSKSEACAWS